MKKGVLGVSLFLSIGSISTYANNPASMDWVENYVQQQIANIPAGTTYTAGQGISITGSVISSSATYTVGENALGGTVFYVDSTGMHGLVVSSADQSSGITWYNTANRIVNANSTGIAGGKMNTSLIVSESTIQFSTGTFAALLCVNYAANASGSTSGCATNTTPTGSSTCYADWYLPSISELLQLGTSGEGPISGEYWSSTEDGSSSLSKAWAYTFGQASTSSTLKSTSLNVRCIRAF